MKAYFKKRFAVTDNGAKDLVKSTFACFLTYCINMLPAILLMIFIDDFLMKNQRENWVYIVLSIVTLVLLNRTLFFEYNAQYDSTYKESANLRIEMAEILAKLPLSYFYKNDLSDLSQTIMSDIDGVEHAMTHSIPKVGAMLFFFPLISLLLLAGNFKLGLAIVIPTLFSLWMVPLSKKFQIKAHKASFDDLRSNSEAFQEAIELQQEIKSFHLSQKMKSYLDTKMEQTERIKIKSELVIGSVLALSSLFSYISLAAVIIVGAYLYAEGEVSILYVVGYLLATMKIKDAMDGSKEGILEIFNLDPKINRIREIRETKIQEGSDTNLANFDIELKNVSFAYDKDTPVLNGVSFKAKQGEVTALVGASGCGKTTVLRLISRLYDYDKGEILIDGKDIKSISTKSLFEKTSIVFQDVTLFNTSVMENIRIGKQSASDEEVKKAAELAGCTEFIEKMEQGYDTLIGENGAELSGGERQRLSIARAFLKDAPILILDEISASLDVDNEKKIQDSLNRLIQNKTVIIISHRLKSIEKVNKIVVIDEGIVEKEGTHQELLQSSKIYANLIAKTKMAEEFVY